MSKSEQKKKKQELDELRKLGVAPAQEDEDGYYINPHIPAYMAEAPWYINKGVASLSHQRLGEDQQEDYSNLKECVKRGIMRKGNKVVRAKRFVKGACENCGARTHKTKHCVERPRKRKAKFTNKNIAPDEHVPESLNLAWDGKRDRWANYDVNMHQFEVKKWEKVEKMRKQKREKELHRKLKEGTAEEQRKARKKLNKIQKKGTKMSVDSDSDADSDSDSEDESDEMADKDGKVIQNFDVRHRQTVRNLRIREDLPKYLRNLNPDSAFYDPKTRSMRANPYIGPGTDDLEAPDEYTGDIRTLKSGEVTDFNMLQKFSMKTQQIHGMEIAGNMLISSNPTSTEMAFRKHVEKKKEKTLNQDLIKKYGGMAHLKSPKKVAQMVGSQSEYYVEYLPDGREKDRGKVAPRSKYVEDEHPNGHSSVWGSYFDRNTMTWGYACCKAATYSAYCTKAKSENSGPVNMKKKKKLKRILAPAAKPAEYFEMEKKTLRSGYVAVRGVASKAKQELADREAKRRKIVDQMSDPTPTS